MKFELSNNEPKTGNETTWVKWYDDVKNVDDTFTIKADKVIFKGDEDNKPVFYVIDEEKGEGISVFCEHHPNAKHTDSTPHGIRLANAIGRCFAIAGEVTGDELAEYVTEHPDAVVKVTKTDKGILWSIGIKGNTKSKKSKA